MKIVGYLRVSTEGQAESGLGLDAQRQSIENYALKSGIPLVEVFSDEGLSGSLSLEKRPGMLSAISSLEKGDLLVVAKRDRLGRDPLVVAMIESAISRKGARIVSTAGEGTENDCPSSILMRRMIDAFSEYERLIIKARTKSALKSKKDRGQRCGHIPFGYRLAEDGVHIEECPKEQDILRQMKELHSNGLSIREIARELNERKAFNRGESLWNNASVHRHLKMAA